MALCAQALSASLRPEVPQASRCLAHVSPARQDGAQGQGQSVLLPQLVLGCVSAGQEPEGIQDTSTPAPWLCAGPGRIGNTVGSHR